jgi:hypothetical protein
MKNNLFALFIIITALLSINPATARAQDTIRVLAIGNSFSQDAVEMYFHELGANDNVCLIVGNAYIGGCSLEKHLRYARNDSAKHNYRKIGADGTATVTKNVSLKTAVIDEAWDYITLQQVSGYSGIYDSFFPSLTDLKDYVKSLATNPHLKFALHMTWAYAQDSNHKDFGRYGRDQPTMYRAIVNACRLAANQAGIDVIIPSGTAIQNGRSSSAGDRFCRDGYHLDLRIGRYTAACTWYEKLVGKPVAGNRFVPEGMSDAEIKIARHAAHCAVVKPYDVTHMEEY